METINFNLPFINLNNQLFEAVREASSNPVVLIEPSVMEGEIPLIHLTIPNEAATALQLEALTVGNEISVSFDIKKGKVSLLTPIVKEQKECKGFKCLIPIDLFYQIYRKNDIQFVEPWYFELVLSQKKGKDSDIQFFTFRKCFPASIPLLSLRQVA